MKLSKPIKTILLVWFLFFSICLFAFSIVAPLSGQLWSIVLVAFTMFIYLPLFIAYRDKILDYLLEE